MNTQILQQQMQTQMQQSQPGGRDHETRLGNLEYAVNGIATRLDTIANKLDSQGKPPWGTIIAAFFGATGLIVTIVSTIGALAFSPLSSGIADVKASMVKFESRTDSYMKREDIEASILATRQAFTEKFAVGTERRNDLQAKTDDRIARVERDVDAVTKQVVPRGEHETVRQLQQRDYDLLRNRLDRVEARYEKRSDGIAREVERLQERAMTRTEALTRNDAQDRVTGMIRGELDEHVRAFTDRQQRTIDRLDALPRK